MKVIFLGCGYLGYNLYSLLKDDFDAEMWGIDSPYVSRVKEFKEINAFDAEEMQQADFNDAVIVDGIGLVANNAVSDDETAAVQKVADAYANLMKVLKKGNARRFIFFSSGGTVYGSSSQPISEDHVLNPQTLYAKSKTAAEAVIQSSGIDYLILRLSNPYGGYQISGKRQGVIPILIRKALTGNPFEMWVDGDSVRDYFYITDFAEALKLLIQKDISNQVVNVGSGIPETLNDVIQAVEDATDQRIHIEHKSSEVAQVQSIVLNIDRLKKLTGFEPEVSLQDGIAEEVKRIEKEQIL